MTERVDVIGIGNAIVDVVCSVEDEELEDRGLIKGSMALIDAQIASELNSVVQPVSRKSGGSVANSLVHIAQLGGNCQLVGKVADDETGQRFIEDTKQAGVQFNTASLDTNTLSGRCFVFVSIDGQRTMCTYLGASSKLSDSDVDSAAIAGSKFLLIEGYLWSSPSAKAMILKAASIARESDTCVAFTLSDPYLVDAHQSEFQDFVEKDVDLLFANEHEGSRLYGTRNLNETIAQLKQQVAHVVITRGESGSVAVFENQTYHCDAAPVTEVVDTTGAGDAYAGGYLFGLTQQYPIERCMQIASDRAAKTIGLFGGRV